MSDLKFLQTYFYGKNRIEKSIILFFTDSNVVVRILFREDSRRIKKNKSQLTIPHHRCQI